MATPGYAGSPPASAPTSQSFAGFWIRFIAYLIDAIGLGFVGGLLGVVIAILAAVSGVFRVLDLALYAALIGYFPYMWHTQGASLGQQALGLKVVDEQTGGRLSVGTSVIRYVGLIISAIPVYLGLMWAGWDPRKQGWHDKMAHSLVLRT